MINYSMFRCNIGDCPNESTKIWAGKESGIIDVCDDHYQKLTKGKK